MRICVTISVMVVVTAGCVASAERGVLADGARNLEQTALPAPIVHSLASGIAPPPTPLANLVMETNAIWDVVWPPNADNYKWFFESATNLPGNWSTATNGRIEGDTFVIPPQPNLFVRLHGITNQNQ